MPDMAIAAVLGILCIFGSPVIITWMILNARKQKLGSGNEAIAALRHEMDELRQQMEANNADITLMLDDIRRTSLPGNPTS